MALEPDRTIIKTILFCKFDEPGVRALLDRGASVVLLLEDVDVSGPKIPEDILDAVGCIYQIGSLDSIEELEAVLADMELSKLKIDRVASTSELSQYGAGYLSMRLGIDPNGSSIAANSRDKRRMKMRAREVEIPTAAFATIRDFGRIDQLEAAIENVGLPLILKPSNGVATIATTRVFSGDQLGTVVADFKGGMGSKSRQLVAEQCITGDEYHVDAVWRDGEPWIFAVSRYFCPRLTLGEGGRLNGAVLLPEVEHTAFYGRVRELHERLNGALGIRHGATHLEIFHDPDSDVIYFSEIATRVGGACIPETIGARFGVDLRQQWAHELLGKQREELPWREAEFAYVAWINLGPKRPGLIVEMPNRETLLTHPNILSVHYGRKEGDRIRVDHPSVWCLMLVLGADTEVAILELVEEMQYLSNEILVTDVPTL